MGDVIGFTDISFERDGRSIHAELWLPHGSNSKPPVVLLAHGFTNNRLICPLIKESADALLGAGIAVVRFDHHGSGDSDGLFRDKTVSGLVADLTCLTSVVRAIGEVDATRIGLWGRSFGGSVVLLAAESVVGLKALFVAAPVRSFSRFFLPYKASDTDYSPLPERYTQGRIKGPPALSAQFFDELPSIDEQLCGALDRGIARVLLAHGRADTQVPIEGSLEIYDRLLSPKRLLTPDGAPHTFAGAEREVVDEMARWFVEFLKP